MFIDWTLSCSLPQLFITDLFWSLDAEDTPLAVVDECLYLMLGKSGLSPSGTRGLI
jgi:hypothetical protein